MHVFDPGALTYSYVGTHMKKEEMEKDAGRHIRFVNDRHWSLTIISDLKSRQTRARISSFPSWPAPVIPF